MEKKKKHAPGQAQSFGTCGFLSERYSRIDEEISDEISRCSALRERLDRFLCSVRNVMRVDGMRMLCELDFPMDFDFGEGANERTDE